MSTFTKTGGRVIFEHGGKKFSFSNQMTVMPHPADSAYIIISDEANPKDMQSAFKIMWQDITIPVGITSQAAMIQKLTEDYFDSSVSASINVTGLATSAKQDTTNDALNNVISKDATLTAGNVIMANILTQLQNNKMFTESIWKDATNTFYIRRTTYNEGTGAYVTTFILPDGTTYVPTNPQTLAVSNSDIEFRNINYVAIAGGTGYSINDYILRSDLFDVSSSPAILLSTIWFNQTTGLVITPAPVQNTINVVNEDAEIAAINNLNTAIGAKTDAEATTDTGTFSLISLIKRLLGKITTLNTNTEIPTGGGHISNLTIGTSATRIDATSHACKKAFITASQANTGYIKVGFSTLTSSNGIILYAGDTIPMEISNTNLLYALAEVNGEDVSVTYTT
jgi:hypothetical protein